MSRSGHFYTCLCALFGAIIGLVPGCSSGGNDTPPAPSTNTSPTPPTNTGQPGRFGGGASQTTTGITRIIAAPDGSGDVYVTGDFTTYNDRPVRPVVRIRPDGSLNETFALAASISPPSPGSTMSLGAVDDGSGDIYVSVMDLTQPVFVGRIWKVNPDGTVDPSFPQGEVVYMNQPDFINTIIFEIVSLGDGSGRAYVSGAFNRYNGAPVNHLVRLSPSGLDPTFQSAADGPTFTVVPADDGTGDLYVLSFGVIDVANSGSPSLYRMNADGSVDLAFNRFTPSQTLSITPNFTAALPVGDGSGDVFVSGSFFLNSAGGLGDPNAITGVARINPDGTLDVTSPRPIVNFIPTTMVRATDGTRDFFIGPRVMRFKADSTIDPTFTVGSETGFGMTLLPLADGTGDMYVGARNMTTYNSVPVGNLVRLNGNGTLDGR